ncbi:MAG TPA: hypothetical protein VMV18_12110, partial [bacterium]|nr:hypothetical protein [bacterium]
SKAFRDNWTVGYTREVTVAVWVGNFDGSPMHGVSGVAGAGPLLSHLMLIAAQRIPPGDLARPDAAGMHALDICRVSGMRAGPGCPRTTEWFAPGTEPRAYCDWHHDDGSLALPAEYAEWSAQSAAESQAPLPGGGRIAVAPIAHRAAPPRASTAFRIVSPRDGDRYRIPPGVPDRYATVALLASGAANARAVSWFVDGRPAGSSRLALTAGEHVIRAEAAGRARDEVRIRVE